MGLLLISVASLSAEITEIASDSTAVVAALGKVRIGSIASNRTKTGGTGTEDNQCDMTDGTTATPLRPAAEIP